MLYGLFLVVVTLNVPPVADAPLCKPGNWVLDTFQPMISDEEMIDALNKNKEVMTRVAEMAGRLTYFDYSGEQSAEFLASSEAARLRVIYNSDRWAEHPYSTEGLEVIRLCYLDAKSSRERDACLSLEFANGRVIFPVLLNPTFGKTSSRYFCKPAVVVSKN